MDLVGINLDVFTLLAVSNSALGHVLCGGLAAIQQGPTGVPLSPACGRLAAQDYRRFRPLPGLGAMSLPIGSKAKESLLRSIKATRAAASRFMSAT